MRWTLQDGKHDVEATKVPWYVPICVCQYRRNIHHNLGVCFLPSLFDRGFSNHGSDEHDLQQDELGLEWWGSTADEVPFAANDQSRLKVQMRALRP